MKRFVQDIEGLALKNDEFLTRPPDDSIWVE